MLLLNISGHYFSVNERQKYSIHMFKDLLFVFLVNAGGEGLKHSLHIPGVYFKRFLPVSNLVSLNLDQKYSFSFNRKD